MQYGVDIASTRLDDLDKRVLGAVKKLAALGQVPRVLDAGCGQGGLTRALLEAGASVVALDVVDYRQSVMNRLADHEIGSEYLEFVQADVVSWATVNHNHFDIVVLQRVLHYLPYADAKKLLCSLRDRADCLYLAVSGLHTAIGNHYEVPLSPVARRWGILSRVGQELFSITAPLCLYTESEVRSLLEEAGWHVEWLRVSDFGNIKVGATKIEHCL